jgi:uncharacterized delta-60 repeat protein
MKTRKKMFRASFRAGLFFVVFLSLVGSGFAQESILDETFGPNNDGLVTTDVGAEWGSNRISSLALQPDGKIVAAGMSQMPTNYHQFTLVRYNADGTLDAEFGSGGNVVTQLSGFNDVIKGLVLQPDGKIVAGGFADYGNGSTIYMAVARYLSNGALDAGFGQGGIVKTDWSKTTGYNYIESVALQPDGKILAAGTSKVGTNSWRLAVVRYNANGTLDTTFGSKGIAAAIIYNNPSDWASNIAYALTVQPNGKIVAVGSARTVGGQRDIVLMRFTAKGARDQSFGKKGVVITKLPIDGSSQAVMLQSNGMILVGVNSAGPGCILRYKSGGTLDKTFGQNGMVSTTNSVFSLALKRNGSILTGGVFKNETNEDFSLGRYSSNGTLDTNFGNGGSVDTDFAGGNDAIQSVLIQSNNKVVAAGYAFDGTKEVWALARYNDPGVPMWAYSRDQRALIAQHGKPHHFTVAFDRTGLFRCETWSYWGEVNMIFGFADGVKTYQTELTTSLSQWSKVRSFEPGEITVRTTPAHLKKLLGKPSRTYEETILNRKHQLIVYFATGLTSIFDVNQILGAASAPPIFIN